MIFWWKSMCNIFKRHGEPPLDNLALWIIDGLCQIVNYGFKANGGEKACAMYSKYKGNHFGKMLIHESSLQTYDV